MKFNEETLNEALQHYLSMSTFWKEMYENAPEMAKKRLRAEFWSDYRIGEHEDIDLYRAYRDSAEREMTYEDAAYLAEHYLEGPGKEHFAELRDTLEMGTIKMAEKLDQAMDVMAEDWPDCDREAFEKTRRLMRELRENPSVKYDWLWRAVGGSGEDCNALGDLFLNGCDAERDEDLSFFWFRRGALSGDGESCRRIALIYEKDGHPRFDMSKAFFWFSEAVRRRSLEARIDLGARLSVWECDLWRPYWEPEVGFRLLKAASKERDGERALLYLGRCYELGVGTPRHLEFARIKYRKAMIAGIDGAQEANSRVIELLKVEKYNQVK